MKKRVSQLLALLLIFGGLFFIQAVFAADDDSINHPGPEPHFNEVREIGLMEFIEEGECQDDVPDSIRGNERVADLTFKFSGGLVGCLYTYVDIDTAACEERGDGSWQYSEEGNELFIGTYEDGEVLADGSGTLTTRYWFEATFPTEDDCANFTNQIDGGCIHEFIPNRGTGVFKQARGFYGVIDNIVDGAPVDFPYILELRLRNKNTW